MPSQAQVEIILTFAIFICVLLAFICLVESHNLRYGESIHWR
jgi:hypothetical protein